MRWGVRGRVVAAALVTLALGLGILIAAANLLLADQLDRDASNVLRDRVAAQLATVSVHHGRVIAHEGPRDDVLDQRAWVFANGQALERAPGPTAVQRAAAQLAVAGQSRTRDGPGDVRLYAAPIVEPGGRIRGGVVAAVSLVPYEDTEHIGLLATIALSAFVLLAGAIVAWRAVGAALRPVADMTAHAEDWSEHDLHRRFDLGPPRDELTGLAATLDGLLARIEGTLRHEQRFSAEVAHELRTPLAGMRAEAELGLRSGPDGRREALERVVAMSERLDGVIESLLTIGRQEIDPGIASADAAAVARAALDACEPAAEAGKVRLRLVSAPGLRVATSGDVVARALQPLLDNAVRHARSSVRISVVPKHTDVLVRVEDDGDGLAARDLDAVFDPGHHAAGSNGSGAGLGLPLARRLARSCGGDVEAAPGPGGRVTLRLPSA
jgi:signal transduction histidine kinase